MSKTTDLIKKKLKRYKAKKAAEKEKSLRSKSHIDAQNKRTFKRVSRREEMEDGHSPLPSDKMREDKYYEERNQLSRFKKNLDRRWNKENFDDYVPF